MTPHDSALGGSNVVDYNPNMSYVNEDISGACRDILARKTVYIPGNARGRHGRPQRV